MIKNNDKSLPQEVVELLINKNLTISSAESCTGGLFVKMITDIAGSSKILNEAYITYANAAKTKILGVREETLMTYGAVSEQTALEMVRGLGRVSESDVCVVFTGIAGPGGGTPEKPVGLVYMGISIKGNIEIQKLNLSGSRDEIRNAACICAFSYIKKNI